MIDLSVKELEWHDSEILQIEIDRKHPGKIDDVRIRVKRQGGEVGNLLFKDCYKLVVSMNMGIIAAESVLELRIISESEEINSLKSTWKKLNIELDFLKCFEIETISSASCIKIFCLKAFWELIHK